MNIQKADNLVKNINGLLASDPNLTVKAAREQIGISKSTFCRTISNLYKYNKDRRQYEAITDHEREVNKINPEENKNAIEGLILTIEDQRKLLHMLNEKTQEAAKSLVLPNPNDKKFKTTIRVNDKVWNRFNKFCSRNKDQSKKDHLSIAIMKYLNEYNN